MPPKLIATNTLFYGDNLDILREYFVSETVDLVYLDPPFNSNRNYNVLFADESGRDAQAQILAFEDTWHWSNAAFLDLKRHAPARLMGVIDALVAALGKNQLTAYLVMMAARLIELHRVLKPTGSLYLHCDPTASHYLKMILDIIFGSDNFRNEITWLRHNARKHYRSLATTYQSRCAFYSTIRKLVSPFGTAMSFSNHMMLIILAKKPQVNILIETWMGASTDLITL